MIGERPPEWFTGDGCTCSPDYIFGQDLTEACRYHDWQYHIGSDRKSADLNFYHNLVTAMEHRWFSVPIATIYYIAVRMTGGYFAKK